MPGPGSGNTVRAMLLNELRRVVVSDALKVNINWLDAPPAASVSTDQLDRSVLALADKLREPEVCPVCGQELLPKGATHDDG